MSEAQLVMARTMYGEARGEGEAGMVAVAHVIMNRAALPRWWGDSIISVAMKPYQFSAWNEDDPNRAIIENLLPGYDPVFDLAYDLAGKVISGEIADPTGGATHYHTSSIDPHWNDDMLKTALIGAHEFYRVA